MVIKIIGAVCILGTCCGFGYYLAWNHMLEVSMLRKIIRMLDFMECELEYRLTPLPQLSRMCASEVTGVLTTVFTLLAEELDKQLLPDVGQCMNTVINNMKNLPALTKCTLKLLGSELGRFDLAGQVRCLDAVRSTCNRYLNDLNDNKDQRVQRYKTLGLCTGAALIIIFI